MWEEGHEDLTSAALEVGRGSRGILDLSTTFHTANFKCGTLVHDSQQTIEHFLFDECRVGSFRRAILCKEEGKLIVFWQHFMKAGVIEYLLDVKQVPPATDYKLHLQSIEEQDLTQEVASRLVDLRVGINRQTATNIVE